MRTELFSNFLDDLDKDASEHSDVFTEEIRQELVGILQEYMDTAHKYAFTMDPENVRLELRQWILTMRVVEFKIEKMTQILESTLDILEGPKRSSRVMKGQLTKKLKEIQKWLATM